MHSLSLRCLPALLMAALANTAMAAGFQLWEQNASGIGTAYAGSAAVADNASTIFYNPAGLTLLPGRQISLGLSGVRSSFEFRDQGSVGVAGGNGGDAGSWSALPNAYLSWQLSPEWYAGMGISSPFGLSTKYDDANWIGRFHSLKSSLRTVNVNPSLAYRLSDKVSLGFGVDYQKIDAEMTSAAGAPLNYLRVKGDDTAWGWNAGALFTLSPAMRVGVSYRSAIKYNLTGDVSTAGFSDPAEARLKLPDTFILSVWQQVTPQWEAMGDLSYTRWNSVKMLNVVDQTTGASLNEPFNYHNAWRFAWGAAYKANDAWKLKFGVAYDRTPTSDGDRSARVPDNDRIWLSMGGQWRPYKDSTLDFGYAYLYLKDPSINNTRAVLPAGTASLRGHYKDSGHVLGVQYSQGF